MADSDFTTAVGNPLAGTFVRIVLSARDEKFACHVHMVTTLTETIIAALLPIVVTLLLGFFAGWHQDFNAEQGGVLNKMVMLYALPLTLFAGMVDIDRATILAEGGLAGLICGGMIIGYLVVFGLARYVFHRDVSSSALQALAIAGPAIPFVGVPVLGFLYGNISTVPVAVGSLTMNLFQVPLTLFLLSSHAGQRKAQVSFVGNLLNTIREPVVWAPILAFLILMVGLHVPSDIVSSFKLLGQATGGVALFASGVVLYSYSVVFDRRVTISVVAKNLIVPALILLAGRALSIDARSVDISVITMAIPTASVCVIFAVQYRVAAQEMASVLFFSTLCSVLTMGGFLYLLH